MKLPIKMTFALVSTAILGLMMSTTVPAEETVTAKVQEAGRDAGRDAKKIGRKVKDKTCEMVNGKMKCAASRVKHGIQNGADKVEDAVE